MNRCAICIAPYCAHIPRQAAAPLCPNGKNVYREMTEAELDAAYRAEFGDGPPMPIATFDANNPADVERARNIFGADAMREMFGPGGDGMAEFLRRLEASA